MSLQVADPLEQVLPFRCRRQAGLAPANGSLAVQVDLPHSGSDLPFQLTPASFAKGALADPSWPRSQFVEPLWGAESGGCVQATVNFGKASRDHRNDGDIATHPGPEQGTLVPRATGVFRSPKLCAGMGCTAHIDQIVFDFPYHVCGVQHQGFQLQKRGSRLRIPYLRWARPLADLPATGLSNSETPSLKGRYCHERTFLRRSITRFKVEPGSHPKRGTENDNYCIGWATPDSSAKTTTPDGEDKQSPRYGTRGVRSNVRSSIGVRPPSSNLTVCHSLLSGPKPVHGRNSRSATGDLPELPRDRR